MSRVTPLGDHRVRLSPGYYWVVIGPTPSATYIRDQLAAERAMNRLIIIRSQGALWSVDEPAEWVLFEITREADWQLYPGMRGPGVAPEGPDTVPADVGQEWSRQPTIPELVGEGAAETVAAVRGIGRWVALVGAGLGVWYLLSRRPPSPPFEEQQW